MEDSRAREAGFSLIEVIVAMSIMLVIAEAVSVSYIHMYKQSQRTKLRSGLDEQLKLLGNYFTNRLQGIGGGAARPWASEWVEDNCAVRGLLPDCGGSDRVTLATSDSTLPECPIVGVPAANRLQIDAPLGVCCLTVAFGNRQGVLSKGDNYSQSYLTNVQLAGCTIDFAPGQGFGGLDNPPASWIGGTVTVVDVSTLYLDMATTELREFKDLNNDGIIDVGEQSVLADQVFDLQFSLGYDTNPRDGRITNANSDADEWLFNSTGANETLGAGGLTGGVTSDLRMISVGLILGEKSVGPGSGPQTVLNGPARIQADWQLSKTVSRFHFRNLGIFLLNG